MRPRSVLLTSTRSGIYRKKYQKLSKNPPETFPKSAKNRGKIKKNLKKSMEKAKMSEERQKKHKKCENDAKKRANILRKKKTCENWSSNFEKNMEK